MRLLLIGVLTVVGCDDSPSEPMVINDDCLVPLVLTSDNPLRLDVGDSATAVASVIRGCEFMRDGVAWLMADHNIARIQATTDTSATVLGKLAGRTTLFAIARREALVSARLTIIVSASTE